MTIFISFALLLSSLPCWIPLSSPLWWLDQVSGWGGCVRHPVTSMLTSYHDFLKCHSPCCCHPFLRWLYTFVYSTATCKPSKTDVRLLQSISQRRHGRYSARQNPWLSSDDNELWCFWREYIHGNHFLVYILYCHSNNAISIDPPPNNTLFRGAVGFLIHLANGSSFSNLKLRLIRVCCSVAILTTSNVPPTRGWEQTIRMHIQLRRTLWCFSDKCHFFAFEEANACEAEYMYCS